MKTRLSVLAALFASGLCTLDSHADLIATVELSNGYGETGGGEFRAQPTNFGFAAIGLALV